MPQIKCKYCDTLVEYDERSKQRKFCNKPACRKQASRERIAEEKRHLQEQQRTALYDRWRCLHPHATEYLRTLLTKYDLEAATLATNAVEAEHKTIQEQRTNQQ